MLGGEFFSTVTYENACTAMSMSELTLKPHKHRYEIMGSHTQIYLFPSKVNSKFIEPNSLPPIIFLLVSICTLIIKTSYLVSSFRTTQITRRTEAQKVRALCTHY